MAESKDRQDRIAAFERHEARLSDGHRGDPGELTDAVLEMGRGYKLLMDADFVKDKDLEDRCANCCRKKGISWPTASIIVAILTFIWRVFEAAIN